MQVVTYLRNQYFYLFIKITGHLFDKLFQITRVIYLALDFGKLTYAI